MNAKLKTRRLAGLAGLFGALLFFCGDMLFYSHFGAGTTFHHGMQRVVQQAFLTRLFTGGLLGPIAAGLCIVGFWQVGANVTPRSSLLRSTYLLQFGRDDRCRQRGARAVGPTRPRYKV